MNREKKKNGDDKTSINQLLTAIFQIVHLVTGLKFDQVFFAGGGHVQ